MDNQQLELSKKYKKEEIELIEKQTKELAETFILLNDLVNQQEVQIETLGDYIENSKYNIQKASEELIKADYYVKVKTKTSSILTGIGIITLTFPLSYIYGIGTILPFTITSLTGLTIYTKIKTE